MCSIFCVTSKKTDKKRMTECFYKTVSRGPDMSQLEELPSGFMGFHRLAIMGLNAEGMQPFWVGKNRLVCNGEIYGFRKIKRELEEKGYSFHSGSDCEILLPMYREYGVRMFEKLDAEFALVLYDGYKDEYIAARDPIGIRPLYYGYLPGGEIVFASEPKNLVGLAAGQILPFPPGCYWQGGEFHRYCDIAAAETYTDGGLDEICKNIREKLIAGVEKRLDSDAPLGFLLSGGLDSSLVCSIGAKALKKPIRTFAIGMATDAIDEIEIKTGRRDDGTAYSFFMFFRKLGQVIAAIAVNGALLGMNYDYTKGAIQTAENLSVMYDMATVIPAVLFAIMAVVLLVWYPLSKKKVAQLQILKEEHLREAYANNAISIDNAEGLEHLAGSGDADVFASVSEFEARENEEVAEEENEAISPENDVDGDK